MRHLRVPSAQTQQWLEFCRSRGWLHSGAGVLSLEDGLKGIPLSDDAPSKNDKHWAGNTIFSAEGITKGPEHWSEHLSANVLEEIGDELPNSYEVQGDILIVKLEQEVRKYGKAIAEAMLKQLPSVRLVCADNGVIGKFRVRDLQPLCSRNDNISTVTQIRENGMTISTDPAKVYFSARLSKEREDNLSVAKELRNKLSRPLRICDPYAGVGPSLASLLREKNLVSECFAGDLNPDAFELLNTNIANFTSKLETPLTTLMLRNIDARNWIEELQNQSKIDFLLVNLPHHSLEHLPKLLPLMSKNHSTVIRGWAIIDRASLSNQNEELTSMIELAGGSVESINCSEVKGFSSSKIFMRFESWQTFS
jgi:tRNA G37 N-methylase Trm5